MLTKKMKMTIAGVLIVGLLSFTAVNSFAGASGASARLKVTATLNIAIKITNATGIDFGAIEKPDVGSVKTVTIDADGTVGGTATQLAGGSPREGSVTIEASKCSTVKLEGLTTNCDDGLTLGEWQFERFSFAKASSVKVSHGNTLTINGSEVKAGKRTCDYTISANY